MITLQCIFRPPYRWLRAPVWRKAKLIPPWALALIMGGGLMLGPEQKHRADVRPTCEKIYLHRALDGSQQNLTRWRSPAGGRIASGHQQSTLFAPTASFHMHLSKCPDCPLVSFDLLPFIWPLPSPCLNHAQSEATSRNWSWSLALADRACFVRWPISLCCGHLAFDSWPCLDASEYHCRANEHFNWLNSHELIELILKYQYHVSLHPPHYLTLKGIVLHVFWIH